VLTSSDIGKAGELRVASELLLRGFHPMMSIVDNGVDITLTNGVTIQAKACNQVTDKNGNERPYFVFTMHTLSEARNPEGRRRKKQKMIADFAVFWCIPDLFFIIPQKDIGGRHTINIPAERGKRESMWEKFYDRWDLLED
jgi:hypothetical protein